MAVKKYLDLNGLTAYNNKLKTVYPKNIAYGDYTPTGGSTARKGFHYDLDMESSGSQSTYTYTLVDLDTLKTDLDIPTSANAFGNVKVGNITIAADTTSDTIEITAGDKIALTPDTTNSTLTIGVSNVPTESGSAGSKTSTAGEGEFVLGSDTNLAKAKTAIQGVNIGGTVTSGVVSGGTDATITNDKKAVFTTLPANTLNGTTSTSLVLGDGVTATTQSQGDNSTKVATTAYVDTAISNLPEPMIFSGGVAVVETVTGTSPNYTYSYSVTLPNDITTLVKGYTFKVTSASGSYPTGYDGSKVAVGDTFIVANPGTISSHVTTDTSWTIIPSGDEPSGTVTEVATGIGLTGGPINTSGTIKVDIQSETAFGADAETESTPGSVTTQIYPVLTDQGGKLAVHVPWTDTHGEVTSVAGKTGVVTLDSSDVGLGNVGNFKAVSTVANQGLTTTEQSNARANIGAGTSNLEIGTTSTTAMVGNKTFTTTIATDTGTNQLTMSPNTKYKLTAGGTSYVFTTPTDTTYSTATTSTDGLMSATDKTKLDGIATGAEVNQNAFSNITVGSTTIEADSSTDTLQLVAGNAVTLTADDTNDRVIIASTDTKNTAGSTADTSKLYLVGAKEQSANPQTYSQANVYATAGKLYSNAKEVVNLSDSQALTNKTYNGYTLAAACAKAVNTSVTYGSTSTNLPTTKAVSDFIDQTDFIERTGSIYIDSTPDAVSSVITITNSTYLPRKGGTIVVKFTYDVLAGTSLKIGSSNIAYPIYLNGTAIESGIITAGTTVTMTFTGSAYEITLIPITNSAIDSLFTS